MPVAENQVVAIDYTLTVEGQIIDKSEEGSPLVYLHGHNNIIPGLEAALVGKNTGDAVSATIEPEQAYGVYDENMIVQIPLEAFPEGDRDQLVQGVRFQGPHPADQTQPCLYTVVDKTDEHLVADANHPLAGQTLNFEVTIGDIRAASEAEVAAGHVTAQDEACCDDENGACG